MNLEICKGGKLIRIEWEYDEEKDQGSYVRKDVTDNVPMYLFEHCKFADDLVLNDIFLLINKHLEFFSICINNWIEEFVIECFQEPSKETEVEYLELYWCIEQDNGETTGNATPSFHGIQDDISHSISGSPLNQYASLPIKLNDTMEIYVRGAGINKYPSPEYSLGQILYGIVWEISYYGPPSKRDATWDMIMENMENAIEQEMDSID